MNTDSKLNMADDLWAWVTEYPDGSIGLVASTGIVSGTMMPLIGRNEEAIRKVELFARAHGKAHGQRVWLRRYACVADYPDE